MKIKSLFLISLILFFFCGLLFSAYRLLPTAYSKDSPLPVSDSAMRSAPCALRVSGPDQVALLATITPSASQSGGADYVVATCSINVTDLADATACRIAIYNSVGTRVGETANITLALGWITSTSMITAPTLVAGQTYYLGVATDTYIGGYMAVDNTDGMCRKATRPAWPSTIATISFAEATGERQISMYAKNAGGQILIGNSTTSAYISQMGSADTELYFKTGYVCVTL